MYLWDILPVSLYLAISNYAAAAAALSLTLRARVNLLLASRLARLILILLSTRLSPSLCLYLYLYVCAHNSPLYLLASLLATRLCCTRLSLLDSLPASLSLSLYSPPYSTRLFMFHIYTYTLIAYTRLSTRYSPLDSPLYSRLSSLSARLSTY